MTTIINTNIASQIAQNYLQNNQSAVTSAITQLSSGLSINSAADNPAGLAIATTLQAQINGQTVATQNANNGISLAQTGESALTQITNNLQTIRQLAVQASNATNSAANRAALNQEVQQGLAQINTIASTTQFNGQTLLDGTFGTQNFQIGANAGQTIAVNLSAGAKTSQIGQTYSSSLSLAGTSGLASQPLSVSVGGAAPITISNAVAGTSAGQNADSAYAAAAAINSADISGLSATATNSQQFSLSAVTNASTTSSQAYNLTINNVNIFGANPGQTLSANGGSISTTNLVNAINQYSSQTGVSAALNSDGSVNLTAADGSDINVSQSGGASVSGGLDNTAYTIGNGTYGSLSATSYGGGSSTSGELQGTVQLQSASSISLSGAAAAAIQTQNTANSGAQLTAGAQTLSGGTFTFGAGGGLQTTLSGGQFAINGINITATSGSALTVSQIAAAINSNSSLAASGITASGSTGKLVLSSTSTPISVSGTDANSILGQTTATNAVATTLTDANVAAAIPTGTLAAGQFTINGINVTGSGIATVAGLETAINNNTQLQALGITASGATLTINATTPIAINVGGTLAASLTPGATQTVTGGAADAALVNGGVNFTTPVTLTAGQLTINGNSVGAATYTTVASLTAAIKAASGNANLSAAVTNPGGVLSVKTSDGSAFTIGGSLASSLLGETLATPAVSSYSVDQTGSLAGIDVLSVNDAQKTITVVDAALNQISTMQGELGAVQNRFTSTISNLGSLTQNAQSAQSSIEDTNYATETSALSRAQVLSQAAQAMVAQANQMPQQVLKLLQ
ncbi:flagellin N-terminal helical domain-containing protein [Paraburkholderia sp. RL17-337-BIB-A]|uniref:flagellin N-terminal helical domain-containing protein n=1 Tax=Paraburkholderia sp. RL17-337-BIB-A TaxID=3031636 RepID=UPI0038BA23CF